MSLKCGMRFGISPRAICPMPQRIDVPAPRPLRRPVHRRYLALITLAASALLAACQPDVRATASMTPSPTLVRQATVTREMTPTPSMTVPPLPVVTPSVMAPTFVAPTATSAQTATPAPTTRPNRVTPPTVALTATAVGDMRASTILVSVVDQWDELVDPGRRLLLEGVPQSVLYADGRLLSLGKKGPWPDWYYETRLSPSQVCALMDRIHATGFMGLPEPSEAGPAQIPTLTAVPGGMEPFHTIDVRGVPSKRVKILERGIDTVIEPVAKMLALTRFLAPVGTRLAPTPVERVILRVEERPSTWTGSMEPWPTTLPSLAATSAQIGAERRLVFSGTLAMEIARAAHLPGDATFTDHGRVFRVTGRPLLPHETLANIGRIDRSDSDFPACAYRVGPIPTLLPLEEELRTLRLDALERWTFDAALAGIVPSGPARFDWQDWHILDGHSGLDLGTAYVFTSTTGCDELIDFYALEGVRVGLTFRGMITGEVRISYPPETLVWSCGVHVLLFRSTDVSMAPTWTVVRLDTRTEESLVVIAYAPSNRLPGGTIGPGPWPSVMGIDSTLSAARLPAPRDPPIEDWQGWPIKDGIAGAMYDQGYLFTSTASCAALAEFYSNEGVRMRQGHGLTKTEFAPLDEDDACQKLIVTFRPAKSVGREFRVFIFPAEDGARVLIREIN